MAVRGKRTVKKRSEHFFLVPVRTRGTRYASKILVEIVVVHAESAMQAADYKDNNTGVKVGLELRKNGGIHYLYYNIQLLRIHLNNIHRKKV